MKILTVGDLHGQNDWEKIDIEKYDKIIFVGDYVDSFFINNLDMKQNLLNLIKLKKSNLDKIVLLFGNHDIQYLLGRDYRCSGFRPEMEFDFKEIFRENENLFQIVFQIKNYLWTHAGVHTGWNKFRFQPWIEENRDKNTEHYTIGNWINLAFKMNQKFLFDVGILRCGTYSVGGPLWLDRLQGSKKPLKNYHQIVGHSIVKDIMKIDKDFSTSITFVDCLQYIIKFYEIEI